MNINLLSFNDYCNTVNEDVGKPWVFKPVSDEEVISLLKKNKEFERAYKNGNLIYRGFSQISNFENVISDSSLGSRTSRDSNNLYQAMLDYCDDNKNYPSRTKSFICTSDIQTAKGYAYPFVMIPLTPKSKVIMVSNRSDFWGTHIDSDFYSGNIISFSNDLRELLIDKMGVRKPKPGLSWSLGEIKIVDNLLHKETLTEKGLENLNRNWTDTIGYRARRKEFSPNSFPLKDMANSSLSYKDIGVKKVKYGDLFRSGDIDYEVWFSGPALCIPTPSFNGIRLQLGLN